MDQPRRSSEHDESDLRGLLSVLQRQRVLIIVCGIVAAVSSYVLSSQQADKFRATARILYTDLGGSGTVGSGDPARAVDTFVRLATTDDVIGPVAKKLGLEGTDEIRADTSVTAASDANLINVSAEGSSAQGAAALANGVARGLINWRERNRELQIQARVDFLKAQLNKLAGKTSPSELAAAADIRTQLTEQQAQLSVPSPELTLVSPATPPESAFSPKPFRNAIFGLLAGLVLGLGLGMFRDRLDRRLRTAGEVEALYPWPVLGMVPQNDVARERRNGLVDFSNASGLADSYRNVRTNLSLFTLSDTTKVWAISSAMPGEGKSAAAANLAAACASSGMKALAISADLHAPALHEYVNSTQLARPGLVEILARQVTPTQAAVETPLASPGVARGGSLHVIANNRSFSDPATLFQTQTMESLLAWARHQYDIVFLDGPPLLYTAEASLLGRLADGLILVARVNHLTRHEALRACRLLETVRLRPTGVILTGVRADPDYGYGYGA